MTSCSAEGVRNVIFLTFVLLLVNRLWCIILFLFFRQTVSGFIYRVMLVKIYASALSLKGFH